jgi:hypothetical protein
MARLFTFGCSFTQYMWPTWADIVAYDMGIKYYNFALAGLGNVGIQHRMIEADLKYKFQQDDIILVMWTGWCREDRVKDGKWLPAGSVLNWANPVYDAKFAKKYWNYSNDLVKNATSIITVNKIYKDKIKWQGTGLPFFFTEGKAYNTNKVEKQVIDLYKKSMPSVDNIQTIRTDNDLKAFNVVNDIHPDVAEHLGIVQNHVYKKMNMQLQPKTVSRFLELQETIESHYQGQLIDLSQAYKYLEWLMPNRFSDIHKIVNLKQLID